MKLSELVAFRSALEQYDFHTDSRLLVKKVLEAKADIDHHQDTQINQLIRFRQGVYQDELEQDLTKVEQSLNDLIGNFDYYKQQIDALITEREEEYIKQSENMYIRDELPAGIDTIQSRQLTMDDLSTRQFYDRVKQLSDWRYPGMIIRPQEKALVEDMASSDPLYLVDIDQVMLEPRLKEMNDIYRHRVRPYGIGKYLPKQRQFDKLPKDQFGLIVIWNTLNNMPLSMCEQTLKQIFDLLRPGGTCLFTYNDCNNAHNVRNFENNYRQFTPGKRLASIIEQLGYHIDYRTNTIHGWMEISRSGELATIKGGQSLARVINADTEETVEKKQLTKEQEEMIVHEAIALGIDSEEKIRGGAIRLGKLELLIKRRKHAIKQEKLLAEASHREQEQIQKNIEIERRKKEKPTLWRATNQGYFEGTVVGHGNKIWMAKRNIEPKQRFDEHEWHLVE